MCTVDCIQFFVQIILRIFTFLTIFSRYFNEIIGYVGDKIIYIIGFDWFTVCNVYQ